MSLAYVIVDVFADTPLRRTIWRYSKTGRRSATTRCSAFRALCVSVTFPAVVTLRGDGRPGVESQQRFYSGRGPARWIRPRVVMMAPL